jgi:hypothetical protein
MCLAAPGEHQVPANTMADGNRAHRRARHCWFRSRPEKARRLSDIKHATETGLARFAFA